MEGNVSKSFNTNKASQKNENPIQTKNEVVIKEEVIEESVSNVIEISDDEDIDTKDVLTIYKAEIPGSLIRVRSPEEINELFMQSSSSAPERKRANSSKLNDPSSSQGAGSLLRVRSPEAINELPMQSSSSAPDMNKAHCSKLNEPSSGQCAGTLIRSRSPKAMNELMKSLNSYSSGPEKKKTLICVVPKYPMSPKYPPNVPKPPAPILQAQYVYSSIKEYIMLTWSFGNKNPDNIVEYQLFGYQERSVRNSSTFVWKKLGDIKAIPLPMACSLTRYVEGETYFFMLRAVDNQKRLGDFSNPVRIKPQKIPASRKTPEGTLLKAPLPNNKL